MLWSISRLLKEAGKNFHYLLGLPRSKVLLEEKGRVLSLFLPGGGFTITDFRKVGAAEVVLGLSAEIIVMTN